MARGDLMASCPACARPVDETDRFCPGCGAVLDPADSPTGTAPRGAAAATPGGTPRRAGAASPERFTPGTVLVGRYRIVGLLGRGGMGEVYRADDLKLEHPVALKFLPRELERDPERIERLYSEVRIARQVSHPHVCRVWDVGEAEGQHFLSMEFVDGENLASLLRRIGRLPGDKALDIARQVASGLAAAHEKGVLHRDLKPANVMLDGEGKVRLTDFGLAGLAEAIRGEDLRSGTPSYMSPEQLQGREVTTRSDIYALGLLLYELFTGRRAFQGRTLVELARQQREERPPEPSLFLPDITAAVEQTILACLEKEPRKRPPSALAVAAKLAGRDPLEAVIAAGDTPSPELVAAAGESERMSPRAAALCLALVLAAVIAAPALLQPMHVLSYVPVQKSPAALEDHARELIGRLGHRPAVADSETGLQVDAEYFRETRRHDRSPWRWDALRAGEPPVVQLWYRQSPRPLYAPRSLGTVSWEEPAQLVSGMAAVRYDLTGRLLALSVVPPQVEAQDAGAAATAPDWTPLFAAARLDPSAMRPVRPRWNPPFQTDARAAWEGVWPRRPEIPIRVEAAAYRGRPVWFEIVDPWTRPERDLPFVLLPGEKVTRAVFLLLIVGLAAAGAVLARNNIRLGRGDRRAAFRLALTLAALGVVGSILRAHHVMDSSMELGLLARVTGMSILVAALVWLFYLALEPYVRRLRPWTLVSWTRLLGGGVLDAVVGRDVLMGMAWGSGCATLLLPVIMYVPRWLGRPETEPQGEFLGTLLGLRPLLGFVLDMPVNATLVGLGLLLLFLVLRFVTRHDLLAAGLVVAIMVAAVVGSASDQGWLLAAAFGLAIYGSYVYVLLRLGVLAAITGWCTLDLLAVPPQSTDAGSWTASATVVVVPLLGLLAIGAFRTAVGGHLGLRRYLGGDAPSSSSRSA